MSHALKLAGQTFGRLTVLQRGPSGLGAARWWCRCRCGEQRLVFASNLVRGHTQSCGCLERENRGRPPTHGFTTGRQQNPVYAAWANLIYRCTNPRAPLYRYYGGRGIQVCVRWRESFEAFFADVGPRPAGRIGRRPAFSIDRIDNDGNYEPGNVRWATLKEQRANQRRVQRPGTATI